MAGLTAALLIYACAAQYTRHEHVSGYLVPDLGLITVAAPQAGIVQARYVAEGDVVRRGARLYTISSDHAVADAASAEALALQTLERRRVLLKTSLLKQGSINRIDRDSIAAQIRSTIEEIGTLASQMATQQQRVNNASAAVERYRKLVDERFVSEAQLQMQQDALLEQQNRLQELARAKGALERE
ncbi:HlyD family efflux transporter periplasmic adaptor subunit, partial [Oxalobacteraceae bacterium A2-2]